MAGTVLDVKVNTGDKVTKGQEIFVMESMKMEVPVLCPFEGTVVQIFKATGDFVNDGESLVELS